MDSASAASTPHGEKPLRRQPRAVTAAQLRRPAPVARPRRTPFQIIGTRPLVDPDAARQRLSLRQIAQRGGTSVSAARRYARRGLLPDALHTPTFGWLFPPRAVERLALIRAARTLGLSLAQIAVLCHAVEEVAPPPIPTRGPS